MRAAARLGAEVRERYAIQGLASEDDLDRALEGEGVLVAPPIALAGRLKAIRINDVIVLKAHLDSGWRRASKAHELGHFLMHDFNAFYLGVPHLDQLRNRYEREAQAFAGSLILGEPDEDIDDRLRAAYDEGLPLDFLFGYVGAVSVKVER